jgi:hypothetical protein
MMGRPGRDVSDIESRSLLPVRAGLPMGKAGQQVAF